MDRYGLIGCPIGHSGSPKLFAEAYGGALEYDLIETQTFEEAWDKFINGPYRAVNVTAPFKIQAAGKSDWRDGSVEKTGAANILVRQNGRIEAFNSDYFGLRLIFGRLTSVPDGPLLRKTFGTEQLSCVVIGYGGAGKAAAAAATDSGFKLDVFHHDEISDGVEADIVVYTLPSFVCGAEKIRCKVLVEANYRDSSFVVDGKGKVCCMLAGCGCAPVSAEQYIPGTVWLRAQAITGYPIMTGREITSEEFSGIFAARREAVPARQQR